jgi:major vault protein
LITRANKISDIVQVETRDLCKLNVKLSYRVHFEGDPESWFGVENYVKLLCDHMRSKMRNAAISYGIEEFYTHSTSIVRDVVLGKSVEGQDRSVQRGGTSFDENGMRIYDVEVLSVDLENRDVAGLLMGAQREAINQVLSLQTEQRKLSYMKQIEEIKQETALARFETTVKDLDLKTDEGKRRLLFDLATVESNAQVTVEKFKHEFAVAENSRLLNSKCLEQEKDSKDLEFQFVTAEAELRMREMEAEVQAVISRGKALDPALFAALNAFGERAMVEKIAEAMAPLSIIGGGKKSVVDILGDMLAGTSFASHLRTTNGHAQLPPVART